MAAIWLVVEMTSPLAQAQSWWTEAQAKWRTLATTLAIIKWRIICVRLAAFSFFKHFHQALWLERRWCYFNVPKICFPSGAQFNATSSFASFTVKSNMSYHKSKLLKCSCVSVWCGFFDPFFGFDPSASFLLIGDMLGIVIRLLVIEGIAWFDSQVIYKQESM